MTGIRPQPGDMLQVRRFLYNHVGIYVGAGRVVHNDKNGGVVLTTLAEFANGSPVELHKQSPDDFLEKQKIVQNARALIGQKFNLLFFNCEHAAHWAQSGKSESPQLQSFAVLALSVLALLFSVRRG